MVIANNCWYGIEFSLIKERKKLKALGAGLISSEGELENALSTKVKKEPFNWGKIGNINRSAHKFHKTLFILKNLDQLEDSLDKWLKRKIIKN